MDAGQAQLVETNDPDRKPYPNNQARQRPLYINEYGRDLEDSTTRQIATMATEMAQFEGAKENIQPARRGRDPTILANVTKDEEKRQSREKLLTEKRAFEEKIRNYDGDDIMAVWDKYIKWTQEHFPSGSGHDANLVSVLERCTRALKDTPKYRNDLRYIRAWIAYADAAKDPIEIFAFLEANRIGEDQALFYEAYAIVLEGRKNFKKADKIYERGINRQAPPLDRLKRHHKNFLLRMAKRMKKQMEDKEKEKMSQGRSERLIGGDENDENRPALGQITRSSAVSGGVRRGVQPRGMTRPSGQSSRATTSAPAPAPAPANNGANGGFTIFCDDQPEASEDAVPFPSLGEKEERPSESIVAWKELPTQQQMTKENTEQPHKWNEVRTIKQSILPAPLAAPKVKEEFEIFVDDELNVEEPAAAKPEPRVEAKVPTIRADLEAKPALQPAQAMKVEASPHAVSNDTPECPRRNLISIFNDNSDSTEVSKEIQKEPVNSTPMSVAKVTPARSAGRPPKYVTPSSAKQEIATPSGPSPSPAFVHKGPSPTVNTKAALMDIMEMFSSPGASMNPAVPTAAEEANAPRQGHKPPSSEFEIFQDDTEVQVAVKPKETKTEGFAIFQDDTEVISSSNQSSKETKEPAGALAIFQDDTEVLKSAPAEKDVTAQGDFIVFEDTEDIILPTRKNVGAKAPLGERTVEPLAPSAPKPLGEAASSNSGAFKSSFSIFEELLDDEPPKAVEKKPSGLESLISQSPSNESAAPQNAFGALASLVAPQGGAKTPGAVSAQRVSGPSPTINTKGALKDIIAMFSDEAEDSVVSTNPNPAPAEKPKLEIFEDFVEEAAPAPPASSGFAGLRILTEQKPESENLPPANGMAALASLSLGGEAKSEAPSTGGFGALAALGQSQQSQPESSSNGLMSGLATLGKAFSSTAPDMHDMMKEDSKPAFTMGSLGSLLQRSNTVTGIEGMGASTPVESDSHDDNANITGEQNVISMAALSPIEEKEDGTNSVTAVEPFTAVRREEAMRAGPTPISSRLGYYNVEIPKISRSAKSKTINQPIVLGERSLMVQKSLGEGAYASVYVVQDLDESEHTISGSIMAMKVQSPPDPWEFHVGAAIKERLPTEATFIIPTEVFVSDSYSALLMPCNDHGSIQDAINAFKKGGKNLDETLVMYHTIELLRSVEMLHQAGIIHGDIKPDNVLIRNEDSDELGEWTASGGIGWESKGIQLIDFGNSIILNEFADGMVFMGSTNTSKFECIEMQEGRPWKYQIDTYGILGTIHCMLFGEYMEVEKDACRWKIKQHFRRYWQAPLWENIFDRLLNPTSVDEVPPLAQLRESLEEFLTKTPAKAKSLKRLVLAEGIALYDYEK